MFCSALSYQKGASHAMTVIYSLRLAPGLLSLPKFMKKRPFRKMTLPVFTSQPIDLSPKSNVIGDNIATSARLGSIWATILAQNAEITNLFTHRSCAWNFKFNAHHGSKYGTNAYVSWKGMRYIIPLFFHLYTSSGQTIYWGKQNNGESPNAIRTLDREGLILIATQDLILGHLGAATAMRL